MHGSRVIPTHIFALAVLVSAVAPSRPAWAGEQASAAFPITAAEARQPIVDELRARGFGNEELPRLEDLQLPVAVPARVGRTLRVASVCWDPDAKRARFRLQCEEAGACVPFLVYVRAAERARAASCRLEGFAQLAGSQAREPVVHPGERATAVLVAAGLRMSAAVVCLERGARGEVIRVRGQEGNIFRARVAGPALVEVLRQ